MMDTKTIIGISISEKLKHYRRIRSLSQEELANASGISIRTIQRIEKGQSIGSSYTISALANALKINPVELLQEELNVTSLPRFDDGIGKLKLLNLSVILVILIPLANIIFPAIIFWKNKSNKELNSQGRRIISFQILWTLCTLAVMVIIPLILHLFQAFRGSKIPLYIPVYFICIAVNICCTIYFAICLNRQAPFLKQFPNIL